MVAWLGLCILGSAEAASLDLVEVGGLFGSPASTGPAATYWNPAGMSFEPGTRFHLELAPTFAEIDVNLADPVWGGKDRYTYRGVVPFAGVATDFGVDGLGVGASLSVPMARGAEAVEWGGPGRYHLQSANIQTVYLTGALSMEVIPKVALGASVSLVDSHWSAQLQTETLTSLRDNLESEGQETSYTDADILNPDYAALLDMDALAARTYTAGAGVYLTPDPRLAISASYQHGGTLAHRGDLGVTFDCPPDEDAVGHFGAGLKGICYAELSGTGVVTYDIPWRTHFGVRWMPKGDPEKLAVELMGGLVGWSQFTDYDIETYVDSNSVDLEDAEARKETAATVSQTRSWARDGRDAYFAGIDAKGRVLEDRLLVGGRALYDRSAVPDHAVSMNNYDTDTLMTSLLVGYRLARPLELAVTLENHWMVPRTIRDSAYAVTLDDANAVEDRYFYPSGNGTYSGHIRSVAVDLRARFGARHRE